MTSPMVDSVRNIPLVIDRDVMCDPMEGDSEDRGFPFDRETRDDDHFRSQLDDLATRHPEFAEHLEGFPFRSHTLGRNRPPRPSDQEFRRFPDRPFGSSRFERFGFPFNSDPFAEDFEAQRPPQQEQQQTPSPKPAQEEQKEEREEERPKERGRKQNIQPSNTVDLGQKQEPVNDRNQRSMSAPPPDNRQRYVSSIHIPINRDGGMGDMGKAQSQQQPQQQEKPANKPTERVIPIHVEGRDEPVVPKHTGPSFSQAQPERIFGHSPSHFTQFVGREQPRQYSAGPEWHHNFGPEVRQQKFQQQAAPPQQHAAPPQQHAAPPQQQKFQEQAQKQVPVQKAQEPVPQQPQPQPPPKTNTPIDIIQSIQKDVSELMGQVEQFAGQPRDKQYLYLDEMLTRNLIKLDNIDTQGQENIRQARKEAIKCIESCIGILEAKAAANVPREKEPEPAEEPKTEEVKEEPKPEEVKEEPKTEESQKMEVEEEKANVEEVKENPNVEEKMEVAQNPVEEKMDAAPEAIPPVEEAPKAEEKPEETPTSGEGKPDEEVKEAAPGEPKPEEETSQDESKEKKKGKKKIAKK